jgi:hypothetical protein
MSQRVLVTLPAPTAPLNDAGRAGSGNDDTGRRVGDTPVPILGYPGPTMTRALLLRGRGGVR